MKKLMFAAAAIVAGVAVADVTSANIVGYQTIPLTPNVQAIKGAAFATVGKDDLSIQDIKMSENLGDGEAQIWWWNGATYDATAYWFTELYDEMEVGLGYPGWGDFLAWTPIEKEFAPGEAFWIQVNYGVDEKDAWFSMAGQVASLAETEEFYTVPLTPNVQEQITNPFPTGTLDIQKIAMSENLGDGEAQIWWWNGATYDATAYWFTELYDEMEVGLGYPGWGDFLAWTPIEKEFTPGEGFWIQVNYGVDEKDAYAKFPNPFYKAPVK